MLLQGLLLELRLGKPEGVAASTASRAVAMIHTRASRRGTSARRAAIRAARFMDARYADPLDVPLLAAEPADIGRPGMLPFMVYNVHAMKHLKVAEARARFGEVLDEAERGAPVYIERRGIRFKVVAETEDTPARSAVADVFAFVDADVMSGAFTWTAGRKGLTFTPRRKAR